MDNKLLEQEIPFVVGTCFMHVRKDQVALGSRRGGSCARPKLLHTTIPGICADMHKASPYSKPSILGDMNTPKNYSTCGASEPSPMNMGQRPLPPLILEGEQVTS